MANNGMLSTEPYAPAATSAVPTSHPMDTSRIMLALLDLSRRADLEGGHSDGPLNGVIETSVLRSLLGALHFRSVATVQHARRVAMLAVGMAQYLGWNREQQRLLEIAALLHDLGKIGVPDSILFKPARLSPDEQELMALQHNVGIDVLQACRVHPEAVEIIVQAHSQYVQETDVTRRPGTGMHQGARILAVADAYDSLSCDQSYRDRKTHREILKVLTESAGTRFDANVVSTLARWIDTEGLPFSYGQLNDANPNGPVDPREALEANTLGHLFSYLYLLESLYDGFYVVDADLRCVVWNRGAERLTERPASEMIGQTWSGRALGMTSEQGTRLSEQETPLHRSVQEGRPLTSRVQLERSDKRRLEVETQSVPLIDENGHIQGVLEIYRDLTRSRRRPQEYRELKLAATRDALTGVANRGELETQTALKIAEQGRERDPEPLSVIFLDVDFFKKINDTMGHAMGDDVLVEIARLLQQETYSGEIVGRYGGEEFVVICPSADLDQALRKAERLRATIAQSDICGRGTQKTTASFGVAQFEPGDSVESLMRRADEAMYKAKEAGRNRVCSLRPGTEQVVEREQPVEVAKSSDPFVYQTCFSTCVTSDLIVYKLGGFVDEEKATLCSVESSKAVIRLGRRGLFSFWGKTDEKRPIEMRLELVDPKSLPTGDRRRMHLNVIVEIRPLGRCKSEKDFADRSKRVVEALRAHFVAD